MINLLAILDIVATDLLQISIVSAIDCDELSDHCEWTSRVDCETGSASVEVFVTTRVSVESTAVRITLSAAGVASVSSVDSSKAICLPNVKLVARWTIWLWCLGIAIACSVLGASVAALSGATISLHRDQVNGEVDSATGSARVDIDGNLLVQKVVHAVMYSRAPLEGP